MRALGAFVVVLLGTLTAPATAQPGDAGDSPEALVAEGERLARDGRIAESLPYFRKAAAREPSGKHECLVALTYFRLVRHPEAWLHIERAKLLGGRPEWCGDSMLVRDVMRALEGGGFAPVEIDTEPSGAQLSVSSLAPEEALAAPVRVWLPWGTQRVRVVHGGYEPREIDVVVEGKDAIRLSVALEPSGTSAGEDTGDLGPSAGDQPRRERDRRGSPRRWPWGLVVVGAASLVGGAGFHLAAASSRATAADLYDGPEYEAEIDRFRLRRTAAIGLYAAGAVLTATGVVLLARRRGERAEAAVDVALVPTQGGAALWLRFER